MLYRQEFAKDGRLFRIVPKREKTQIPRGLMDACDLPKEAARSGGDTC